MYEAMAGPVLVFALTIIVPLVLVMILVGFSTASGARKGAATARDQAAALQAQEQALLPTHGPAPAVMSRTSAPSPA